MASFPSVDEQLAYISKGAAEIIHTGELRSRLEKSLQNRHTATRQSRI